jgi:hypothetical protein
MEPVPTKTKKCSYTIHVKIISRESFLYVRFLFFFSFQFKNLPYADTFDKTLMFTIFDYDRFSKHDRIGEVGTFFNVHYITITSGGLIMSIRKYGVPGSYCNLSAL